MCACLNLATNCYFRSRDCVHFDGQVSSRRKKTNNIEADILSLCQLTHGPDVFRLDDIASFDPDVYSTSKYIATDREHRSSDNLDICCYQ